MNTELYLKTSIAIFEDKLQDDLFNDKITVDVYNYFMEKLQNGSLDYKYGLYVSYSALVK